ncbi:MAG: hypothetical protein V8R80_09620 [Eubacterium sp.]
MNESGKENCKTGRSCVPWVWKKRIGKGKTELTDYRILELKKKDWWMAVFSGFLLTAGAAFLFYRSFAALLLGVILIPLHLKKRKALYQKAVSDPSVGSSFESAMQAVSGALTAGYSMENAFRNAQEESERLYGAGCGNLPGIEADELERADERTAAGMSVCVCLSDRSGGYL